MAPSSVSPSSSLFGPSRSNSVARRSERKPYSRPGSPAGFDSPRQQPAPAQNGILGGLKRSLSRWFSSTNLQELAQSQAQNRSSSPTLEGSSHSRQTSQGTAQLADIPSSPPDMKQLKVSDRTPNSKRLAPKISPERGTPSKKQRTTSPGRWRDRSNPQAYDRELNALATKKSIPRISGTSQMSRSQTLGAYNDPPLSMLAESPGQASRSKGLPKSSTLFKTSGQGLRRSETTLRLSDESVGLQPHRHVRASPLRSPIYPSHPPSTALSGGSRLPYSPLPSGLSKSITLSNLAISSPRQNASAEAAGTLTSKSRGRLVRGGSSTPATALTPTRRGLRSQSRLELDEVASPGRTTRQRSESVRDMSVVPPSPARSLIRSSRIKHHQPVDDQDEELLMQDDSRHETDYDQPERSRFTQKTRHSMTPRMSIDREEGTRPTVNDQAQSILDQLSAMRRTSRHPNIQAGLSSSVQPPPVPMSLSNRQLRKRGGVKVPKASSKAEAFALKSLSTAGDSRMGSKRETGSGLGLGKPGASVMQKPYTRKPSDKMGIKPLDSSSTNHTQEDAQREVEAQGSSTQDKPFTFSMSNVPTQVSTPLNIQFSPSATKIVRSGPSTLRAQSAVTHRKHEVAPPRAGASQSRPNKFVVPDDDDMDEAEDASETPTREPSRSPQPVAIPPPIPSPSPRKKKDIDVTAVRKARGFLDAAGVNRPRASSPLAAAPMTRSVSRALSGSSPKPPVTELGGSSTTPNTLPVDKATTKPATTTTSPLTVPDFFAMPKSTSTSGTTTPVAAPASVPSFSFTNPSPTTSPSTNKTSEPIKPSGFSFSAPSNEAKTPPATKAPAFSFSAPSTTPSFEPPAKPSNGFVSP